MWPRHLITAVLLTVLGQQGNASTPGALLFENKGQWDAYVHFRADLGGKYAYLDGQGLTLLLSEADFFVNYHHYLQGKREVQSGRMHAVKFEMVGADLNGARERGGETGPPSHFLMGNDPSKWSSNHRGCRMVTYRDVWPGIDLRYAINDGRLKYEFIVGPGADPSQIVVEIKGADALCVVDEELQIGTSVGTFKELVPFTFQRLENGRIKQVPCAYQLKGQRLTYNMPEGYDHNLPLVIDPEIAFSTFIGAGSSNFGFTASYDNQGNLYAGAIVFGESYPTTAGAVQVSFGGATVDCAISKFNSEGTELLYSTFLGGFDNEAPHSIVVSEQGEAYVFGTTSSFNFPVTPGAFQDTYGGGTSTLTTVGFSFNTGTDMFVAKLSSDGSSLLGSTFIGGSGNDGIAVNTPFNYNYGDLFRGEIVLDSSGNAYIASVTSSADFPVVGGFASNHSGEISGVAFKLNSTLDEMIWATYSGGNQDETANSIQLASDNSVYISGGTFSTDLATPGAYQPGLAGGSDGYVAHISADGANLLACTYTGTPNFDLNYFVQLNTSGEVYVVGQSEGEYPISEGVYSNPNSGQFIQKLSADLTTGLWSTVVGGGQGGIDISPSAFLVSDCGQIYLAGWGGGVNTPGGNTLSLPVTADAFQSITDGNDFYIMVLSPDADALVYATFFGGGLSSEHVDGGTSRFDKNGTVYQAVCAGCGGNNDFPSQPGVWSQENLSENCNLGVFKFNLSTVQPEATIEAPEVICPGTEVSFINLSTDADGFEWSLGDGTTSEETDVTHAFEAPGIYEVWLYAESSDACLAPDSTSLLVEVVEVANLQIEEVPDLVCPGEAVQLEASGADSYAWSPAQFLNNPASPNPVFVAESTTTLSLIGTTVCGDLSAEITIEVDGAQLEVTEDVAICPGQSVTLSASGANEIEWSPNTALSNPASANPTASPIETTLYTVTATTDNGCPVSSEVQVTVLPPPPTLLGVGTYASCNGQPVMLDVSGAASYVWSPTTGLSNPSIGTPLALPEVSTTYTVTGSNVCGSVSEQVLVTVNSISVLLLADTVVCQNEPIAVQALGGDVYLWQPAELYDDPTSASPQVTLNRPTRIEVTAFDSAGCSSTVQQWVDLFDQPFLTAGRDKVIAFGDEALLEANSTLPISWEEHPDLSCLNCAQPVVNPLEETTYYASVLSADGCKAVDSVTVFVRGNVYLPNAFTPDGDGLNELFLAQGVDIAEFWLRIWNRWGELVFESRDIQEGWNGSKLGGEYFCPSGIYNYYVRAREEQGDYFDLWGHVTLIR